VLHRRASAFGFQKETFRENTLKALSIGKAFIFMELKRRTVKFLQENYTQINFSAEGQERTKLYDVAAAF
jgi:hypothetical protein